MRAIVVGGGIGGLATAIGLRARGHEVLVLERAPSIERVGAGITLFANAMRALDRLGVGDAVRERGAAARRSEILTASGRRLTSLHPELLEGAVAVHRAELQAVLLAAAGGVRRGAEVTSVEQGSGEVRAQTVAGEEDRAEVLIGADGVWSVVRSSVDRALPRYSGYTAWRGISPVAVESGRLSESWGVGERFGLVDIGSRTYWFATANVREGDPTEPSRRRREVIDRFGAWHQPVREVLEATPEEAVLRNDVHFLDPLARWSNGRVVLVGDAAHATTPGVGQGAAQALEDAVALASELGGEDVRGALERYEAARRPRAELALKLSRRADRIAQLATPIACALRNALAARMPASVQRRQLLPLIAGDQPN